MTRQMLWLGSSLSAVALFVAVGLYAFLASSGDEAPSTISSDDIEIIDSFLQFNDDLRFAEVTGRIRNESDYDLHHITMRIHLYGAEVHRVGETIEGDDEPQLEGHPDPDIITFDDISGDDEQQPQEHTRRFKRTGRTIGHMMGRHPESAPPPASPIDGTTIEIVFRRIPPGGTEHFRVVDRPTNMVPPVSWKWNFEIIEAVAFR